MIVSVGILWAFRGASHLPQSHPLLLLPSPSPFAPCFPPWLPELEADLPPPALPPFSGRIARFARSENLSSPDASFETILSLLSSFFIPENDDALMGWVQATLALKGLRGRMDGWREEWRGFVKEGREMERLL